MIKKYNQIQNSLEEMREKGRQRGEDTGFLTLDNLYSIKQGSFTFVLAPPGHGKSEFTFELLLNQAKKFGKRSLIYSPETGSVEDIYAEFIHKLTGKSIYKSNKVHVNDLEYHNALNYIDEMFSIVDSDEKSFSFLELTKLVTNEDLILADPYNELRHDMSQYGARQDLYIEDLCGEIRRYAKKNKKHIFLTLHPAAQQKVEEKDINGKKMRFYPMPLAREAAGGQALLRKSMTWINLWRPQNGLPNEMGMPYEENEVLVMIEKAKPKGASTKGITSLYWDWKKNRYHEYQNVKSSYAFDHEQIEKTNTLSPNLNFDGADPFI